MERREIIPEVVVKNPSGQNIVLKGLDAYLEAREQDRDQALKEHYQGLGLEYPPKLMTRQDTNQLSEEISMLVKGKQPFSKTLVGYWKRLT